MGTTWLLIVVALAGVAVGTAAGTAFGLAARDRRRSVVPDPALTSQDPIVPVLAALRSAVVVLDADDEILRASASAYTFNVVGQDAVSEPRVAQMVSRVRATGVAEDADLAVARGRVPGSGQFFLHVRVAGIGRGRVLVLIDDRTAEKRVEDMRRDFVVNISHELKTPVGAIALLAETIEDNADNAEVVRGFAGRMSKESCRLGVLVQEIIELSRLQEGDALASPQDVDVDAVVAESVDRVRVTAEAREISLVAGGTKGLMVRGDGALIATAVRNLLDNAIRYSDPRTRVSVGVSVDPSDSDLVRIAVVDQGIGIPKEDQERVFERFFRVDKARSRATGGTGLGLSIVKHVAADHGGTVELWSAPGRGSTFTLVLPRLRPDDAAGTESGQPSSARTRSETNQPAGTDRASQPAPATPGTLSEKGRTYS
ncbi:sensor histidine kinase [Actinomyces faecalis]|uniref:sensor histidine kinase n=1 Tax=Actinomyces faecalis TaxID=2722820 RepID=UPI001554B634|nr:ATP-binding protein [Actinomyces faecalis]